MREKHWHRNVRYRISKTHRSGWLVKRKKDMFGQVNSICKGVRNKNKVLFI